MLCFHFFFYYILMLLTTDMNLTNHTEKQVFSGIKLCPTSDSHKMTVPCVPLVVEIFMFECVNRRTRARADGRRLESHPISPPCESVAQVS